MGEPPSGSDGYRAAKQPHDRTRPLLIRAATERFLALLGFTFGITKGDTKYGITYGRRLGCTVDLGGDSLEESSIIYPGARACKAGSEGPSPSPALLRGPRQ